MKIVIVSFFATVAFVALKKWWKQKETEGWGSLFFLSKSLLFRSAESLLTWPADFATSWLAVETGDVPYVLKSATGDLTSWVADKAITQLQISWNGPVHTAATFPFKSLKRFCLFMNLWSELGLNIKQSLLKAFGRLMVFQKLKYK